MLPRDLRLGGYVVLLTAPVTWFDHSLGASVTGGFVYRGPNEPRMNGIYFFGDFISGRIWGLKQTGTNWQRWELAQTNYAIDTFGEDEQAGAYWRTITLVVSIDWKTTTRF